MNGTLPAGDCGYRGGDPRRQSRPARIMRGPEGLECGTPHPSKRGTPPGWYPAAQSEKDGRELGIDGIGTFPALSLGRSDSEAQLLADGAREKAAHTMRLPAGGLHQFGQRGSVGPLQQIEDCRGFTAFPGLARLFRGFGGFLYGAGLLGRPPLLGRNVRAVCANTGLLLGLRFSAAWAVPVSSMAVFM